MDMNRIRILGIEFMIETVPAFEDSMQMGECDDSGIIKIHHALMSDMREKTILHEIIHAVENQLDLNLSETQVKGIATGLYCIYRENNMRLEVGK